MKYKITDITYRWQIIPGKVKAGEDIEKILSEWNKSRKAPPGNKLKTGWFTVTMELPVGIEAELVKNEEKGHPDRIFLKMTLGNGTKVILEKPRASRYSRYGIVVEEYEIKTADPIGKQGQKKLKIGTFQLKFWPKWEGTIDQGSVFIHAESPATAHLVIRENAMKKEGLVKRAVEAAQKSMEDEILRHIKS